MIDKFDSATGYTFVSAAAALLLMPFDDDPPRDVIRVMFTAGLAGGRPDLDDHLAVSNAERKSIIHLEFEGGRERNGPCNIVVITSQEGKLHGWTQCDRLACRDARRRRLRRSRNARRRGGARRNTLASVGTLVGTSTGKATFLNALLRSHRGRARAMGDQLEVMHGGRPVSSEPVVHKFLAVISPGSRQTARC